jgi:hypothetical protein
MAPLARADDAKGGVGRSDSPTGTLLQRAGAGKQWKTIATGDPVPDRDLLLALPGARAVITSGNGAVRLTLWGNTPLLSSTPALESAVSLRQSTDLDLDLILDRGRVVVANAKKSGAANVRLRARDEVWDLVLKEPETEVSIELNGRWPQGMPFRAAYKAGEQPRSEMILFVLKGALDLKVDAHRHTLSAPPGPGLYFWDSVRGPARGPEAPPQLPPWARPGAGKAPEATAVRDALKPLYEKVAKETPGEALADLLASADKLEDAKRSFLVRELAVTGFGATDDLARLVDALSDAKHPDVRAIAVETLRHWIGRGPGQDSQLAKFLRSKGYSEAHAIIFLQLLHSYGDQDIEDPLTYELLIAYLRHEKLPIRELAAWHLYRLVPAGRKIAYNAAGSEVEREKAFRSWKDLIPSGKLPPESKPK